MVLPQCDAVCGTERACGGVWWQSWITSALTFFCWNPLAEKFRLSADDPWCAVLYLTRSLFQVCRLISNVRSFPSRPPHPVLRNVRNFWWDAVGQGIGPPIALRVCYATSGTELGYMCHVVHGTE
eukprot:3739858-Rhodomonas_salina.1